MGILICKNIDINAASLNKKIGTEYAKVVKQYVNFTNYFKTRPNYYPTSSEYRKLKKKYPKAYSLTDNFSPAMLWSINICYRIADINNDKTPELIISDARGIYYQLHSVYTYNKLKGAVLIAEWKEKNTQLLVCKGNMILWKGPGINEAGITNVFGYYKVGKGGKKTIVSEMYWRVDDSNANTYKFYKTQYPKSGKPGVETTITRKQFINIQKKYYKPIKKNTRWKFYKADQSAIKALRNGKATYNVQKSYNEFVPTVRYSTPKNYLY